jgi:hypothetical protein
MLVDILTIQGFEVDYSGQPGGNRVQLDLALPYNQDGIYGGSVPTLISKTKAYFGSDFDENDPFNTAKPVYIMGTNLNNIYGIFFVKNWGFSQEEQIYNFSADLPGIPAQGLSNNNPQPFFYDHVVMEYDGEVFDPSYGTIEANRENWILNSIDGVGVLIVKQDIFGEEEFYYYLDKKINQSNVNLININYE